VSLEKRRVAGLRRIKSDSCTLVTVTTLKPTLSHRGVSSDWPSRCPGLGPAACSYGMVRDRRDTFC